MQELRSRLAEAEETARTAERQKNQLQRLLQEFRRRLTPLQLEMQRMVEKVSLPRESWSARRPVRKPGHRVRASWPRLGSPRLRPGLPEGSIGGPPILALPPPVVILVLGGQLGREGGAST